VGFDISQALADIALLFELSLSVSQSLDLESNCEQFLGRIMSRKNLAQAALWIRRDALPPEMLPAQPGSMDALVLVYGTPRRQELPGVLPGDHPSAQRARAEGAYSEATGSGAPSAYDGSSSRRHGMIAVFPLEGLGILELASLARTQPMSARELSQLATVVGRFAVSVKGCLDHMRMVSEMRARERLDEQLRHAQKMEAVGQLAGGIAHDFNNLLVGIVGSAELLQHDHAEPGECAELAHEILSAAQRAANLTRQLLAFSRREQLVRKPTNLSSLISEVVRLLERTIDRRVSIEIEDADDGLEVFGDDSELQSALLNLGLNARDAMPDGGRLTIRTRAVSIDDAARTELSEPLPAGQYVAIEVEDTGVGMAEAVQRRVFEPFFTTKNLGHGTGLGLAAVYGVVKRHDGAIAVNSAPGRGSRFTLLLPMVSDAQPTPVTMDTDDHIVTGSGTVLVVDDEEWVRKTCARMLRKLGYEVLLASDGSEGLAVFERERTRIDLVVLDMMMPRMSGAAALAKLRAIDPKVPVVVASGFGHQMDVATVTELGVSGTLRKPFTLGELSLTVAKNIH